MHKELLHTKKESGFSVAEVVIAAAVLTIFITGIASALVTLGKNSNSSGHKEQAVLLAEEALEASRNIRDAAFSNLVNGTYGMATTSNQWNFSGSSDINGIFSRQTTISTVSANQKQITSTVSWVDNATLNRSVSLSEYLANWQAGTGTKGGMLVYGNGGTSSDNISFRLLDSSGVWSTSVQTADIDGATSNRALRAARVYASTTRNEYILISRHYNGSTQYVYAQVYNGSTQTWGNVQLLASWTAATFLDVQNFDGTYLSNGSFMAIYSDNTTIPKSRIWNGSSWQAQTSLTNLGASQTPNYIVAKARSGTNEVMAAFFTQGSDVITQYYSGLAWSAITSQATAAPTNVKRLVDFDWSPNNSLVGGLLYTTAASGNGSRQVTMKIWTANGSGSGSWSSAASSAVQGAATTRMSTFTVSGRTGADEFLVCSANTAANVICYKTNFTPTFSNPTNQTITATTDSGQQRSYDSALEMASGSYGINVYSDNTVVPKLKKYNAATTTWDASATSLNSLNGILKSVRTIAQPATDNIMVLLGGAKPELSSLVWDGNTNAVFGSVIGNSVIESNVDSNVVGQAEAFRATAATSSTVTNIMLYLDPTSVATNMTVGIYADSGGHPSTLLGYGSNSSLTSGSWNSFSISAAALTSGTNYWITILSTSGIPKFRDRSGGPCSSETSLSTALSSLPSNWTTGTVFATCPLSALGNSNGYQFTPHGQNGSATTDYWYDFAWQKY